jgi:hypothetical protein
MAPDPNRHYTPDEMAEAWRRHIMGETIIVVDVWHGDPPCHFTRKHIYTGPVRAAGHCASCGAFVTDDELHYSLDEEAPDAGR